MYEGTANWDIIKEVKQSVSIPVIGNGDVKLRKMQTHA
ncbi:tRNA-dihydrouridine synthase [Bacillus licheniformis]|nr:tRNA-dihydrouridine synthase [Bacillus licheniformis]